MLHDLIYGADPGPIVRSLPSEPIPPAVTAPSALLGAAPAAGLPGSMLSLIEQQIAQRMASFTMAEAMRLPSVIRAVQLIASTVAQFTPVAYRDGVAMDIQPRITRRPTPYGTRYAFTYATVHALLAGDDQHDKPGNAFWLVTSRDSEGQATAVIQLANREVSVEWDDRRFLPRYSWRGDDLTVAARKSPPDLIHISLGRPAGALLGVSPLAAGLPSLAIVEAAEEYAGSWFATSGIPSVTLRSKEAMSRDEANKLKAQWMEAHAGPAATPAVLAGGIEDSYPPTKPEDGQMQQARDYGNTVVARLVGIPAPLLHVATSGATITYANTAAALDELVRATVGPTYLPPIEDAYSELVPRTQSVLLETRELLRLDIAQRFGIYQTATSVGMLTAEDARAIEGWPRTGPIAGHTFSAVPAPPPGPRPSEVPVA